MKNGRCVFSKMLALVLTLSLCVTGAAVALGAADVPKEKVKVGMLQFGDHPSLKIIEDAILAGFEEYGIADRIDLKFQNAQFDFAAATTLSNQFIGEGCTLLIPIATPCAQAAMAAAQGTDVDIIFTAVTDPVAAGLVSADGESASQITGVSDEVPVPAVFALAEQLTPGFQTVGLLYNAGEANSVAGVDAAKAYCAEKGLRYVEAIVTSTAEVMQSAQSLVGKADICFTSNDNTVAAAMPSYAQMGLDNNMPIYVGADTMVADGGLATVGINYTLLGKQTARMVKEYLNGTPIEQLPIEKVQGAQPIINADVAEALGIKVPEGLRQIHTGDKLD